MKKNIFVKGLAGILVAGSLASCSEDYLQIEPETSVDTSTVTSSVEGAELALIGMCRAMYQGYQIGAISLRSVNSYCHLTAYSLLRNIPLLPLHQFPPEYAQTLSQPL